MKKKWHIIKTSLVFSEKCMVSRQQHSPDQLPSLQTPHLALSNRLNKSMSESLTRHDAMITAQENSDNNRRWATDVKQDVSRSKAPKGETVWDKAMKEWKIRGLMWNLSSWKKKTNTHLDPHAWYRFEGSLGGWSGGVPQNWHHKTKPGRNRSFILKNNWWRNLHLLALRLL